jgi:hypothetical protein
MSMHGLVNRAVERFARDTYGREMWHGIVQRLDLGFTEFEAMLSYDDEITHQVIGELAVSLNKPLDEVLEDIGTYLVSHPNLEALRRLLRFGGTDFVEFLHSLDDLPGRARLAVPDLQVPELQLNEHARDFYSLTVGLLPGGRIAFGPVMMGLLRAMADDYGALIFLEHKGRRAGHEVIEVRLLEAAFAAGRSFDLGAHIR